jgi:hypothetical protein
MSPIRMRKEGFSELKSLATRQKNLVHMMIMIMGDSGKYTDQLSADNVCCTFYMAPARLSNEFYFDASGPRRDVLNYLVDLEFLAVL